MFTHEWRKHWGLRTDPFACEDADKDYVLAEIDADAVHTGFDRIYGDPRMPAPGIVFGEKGSGKSGLRLMMRRHLATYNEGRDTDRVFVVEYIEFNPYLEHFRGRSSRKAADVLAEWTVSDHLDCLLSLGTTKLVDLCLDEDASGKLSHKQKVNLLLLAALYYDSERRTAAEAVRKLRLAIRRLNGRQVLRWTALVLLTAVGAAVAVFPFLVEGDHGAPKWWHLAGGLLVAGTWLADAFLGWRLRRRARRATHAIRVLARDAGPLASVVQSLSPRERAEFPLPEGNREEVRYELLHRLMDLTGAFGYSGWYALMDRVDEPSLLSGDSRLMAAFVEKLLDIKLLQHPGLALKLFLPIELESLHRSASAEDLKTMRLDKSNLITELKWGGQELLEVANERIAACAEPGSHAAGLDAFLEEGFDLDYLRATLGLLGTPRYSFGFLSALVLDHVKDLPGGLAEDDPAWRIPRARFDIERAAWIDRTRQLRRAMN
jgi:hypothetical protein